MVEPDIFERLQEDHRRVLSHLEAVEPLAAEYPPAGEARARRERALTDFARMLGAQFETHLALEAEALYPALRETLPEARESLAPLEAEHRELTGLLDELTSLLALPAAEARDEQVAVVVRDLADLLRIHIRKEELIVFRLAQRTLSAGQLAALSQRLSRDRARHPEADSPGPATKGTSS